MVSLFVVFRSCFVGFGIFILAFAFFLALAFLRPSFRAIVLVLAVRARALAFAEPLVAITLANEFYGYSGKSSKKSTGSFPANSRDHVFPIRFLTLIAPMIVKDRE